MRIVSLVPSLTELIIDLGLAKHLVGRTKFCIHPSEIVSSIPKIGGTKNVRVKDVIDLKPDLIIANKEENTKEDIEALIDVANVYVSNISTYEEAIEAILEIGKLTQSRTKASLIVQQINSSFEKLQEVSINNKVCYLIWNNPMMSVGKDTFIHDLLLKWGFENIFYQSDRYPTVTTEEIQEKNPDFIFLSSEPFPFREKHIDWFTTTFPESKTVLVDGEYFSWYGSRMIKATDYFNTLIRELQTD